MDIFAIMFWATFYLLQSACSTTADHVKPHIVFIMADDLGWNDVSFHGSDQIPTPNIDTLAYHGVVLEQYYTDIASTATRTALLTGKYPLRLGMQGKSLFNFENRGIPLGERLLPSYLKELGYSTHLVGQWHVGMSKTSHTPTARGFDSFFGNLGGAVDSYTYNSVQEFEDTEYFGLDLYNSTEPVKNRSGYITDVLAERAVELILENNEQQPMFLLFCPTAGHAAPGGGGGLQSPHPDSTIYPSIAHTARRTYADVVTNLDNCIGQIVSALSESGMLKNTLIIFTSDNGAPTTGPGANYGSNLPFRGMKSTPWEGGVRVPALVWGFALQSEIWNGLFHVTDWLPTLVSAAGGRVNRTIDGVNQWGSINVNTNSRRKEVLITVDDEVGFAAYRRGDYKMIIGNVKNGDYRGTKLMALRKVMPAYRPILLSCETANVFNAYLKMSLNITAAMTKRNATTYYNKSYLNKTALCVPTLEKGCLFHVKRDPIESKDLWDSSPDLVRQMTLRLRAYWSEMMPRQPLKIDKKSDPALNNYVWAPWDSEVEEVQTPPNASPIFPLKITIGDLQSLVDVNFHSFNNNLTEYIRIMSDSLFRSVACLFYNSTMCYKGYSNMPQF